MRSLGVYLRSSNSGQSNGICRAAPSCVLQYHGILLLLLSMQRHASHCEGRPFGSRVAIEVSLERTSDGLLPLLTATRTSSLGEQEECQNELSRL